VLRALTAPVSGRILRGTINRKALEDVQRRFTYLLFVAVVSAVAPAPISAQVRTDSSPVYKAPRTADGKPDLQGIWQALNTAAWDIQDHAARLGVPAGQGVVEGNEIPYQPWAAARKKDNFEKRLTDDPIARCYLPGVPRIMYMPHPFQIFQTPGMTTILYEYDHAVRTIYTDRPHLPGHIDFWLGMSRGRWEGETLVVDVIDFNDKTWFDAAGNFHSDALHVVERYTRTGPDHIAYEVTIDDSKVFTRPWKMNMTLYRRQEQNIQLLDYECNALAEEAAGRLK
jgi:hypothetical protein